MRLPRRGRRGEPGLEPGSQHRRETRHAYPDGVAIRRGAKRRATSSTGRRLAAMFRAEARAAEAIRTATRASTRVT